MNKFEEHYFPLKKKFPRHGKRFSRSGELPARHTRCAGGDLTLFEISCPSPVPEVTGKKIVFISDWHWANSQLNKKRLAALAAAVEKLHPEVLLLGGDLCDDAEFLDTLPELLKELAALAPHVIAVNGNWEAGKQWLKPDFFAGLYAQYGITLLENEDITAGDFHIFGLPDISSINFRKIPPPEAVSGKAAILLAHSPDTIIAADSGFFMKDFHLALCGHTHGGQVRIPLVGALYCPSFYRTKFAEGIFARRGANLKMIVSRGIGEHHSTVRIFCPPEAVIVEFC